MDCKDNMDRSRKSSITKYDRVCLEYILDPVNLYIAREKVKENKGAAGVDHMETSELKKFLETNGEELNEQIMKGRYRPSPIRRVYIPKDNGDKRPLGIPTVIDRYVQQAVAQVLSEVYDEDFSDNSFGYRPRRSARHAIKRVVDIANDGYGYVIDLDLSKFFDTVNHSKLLQVLSDKIRDGRVISLIHKFLKAPVLENGRVGPKTTIGTPQGGCISPILANILLNELDQLLDKRGIKFVRYADDMCIFAKSEGSAKRILRNVTEFIEKKLFLKVNQEKTKICRTGPQMQLLGFSLKRINGSQKQRFKKDVIPERCKLYPKVTEKKLNKFRAEVRVILDRRAPGGIEVTKARYNRYIRGWHNYFKGALGADWMRQIAKWIRRRIRQMYWKQWKTPQNRYKNAMQRLGKARSSQRFEMGVWAYSTNRHWRMACSQLMHKVLGKKQIEAEGWLNLESLEAAHWEHLRKLKNDATAVCENRMHSGVIIMNS